MQLYKIHQFSYHYLKDQVVNGEILANIDILKNYQVVQLGVQAPPGTTLLLNYTTTDFSSGIEIGDTGIFELDLKDSNTYITSLYLTIPFYLIGSGNKAKEDFDVLVDILYEN